MHKRCNTIGKAKRFDTFSESCYHGLRSDFRPDYIAYRSIGYIKGIVISSIVVRVVAHRELYTWLVVFS